MTQMHTTWRDVDVSAYVDGELDPTARVAFETALDQDRILRQKVAEMREVVTLMRAIPLREPPRNYLLTSAMVAEKLPQRAQRRPMPLLLMRLATSLAAVAFVVTTGLNVLNRGLTPVMMTEAPKVAEEMVVEATVVVSKEVEAVALSAPVMAVEEGARAEKAVVEEEVAVMAAPQETLQPETAGNMASGQGAGETAPQPEAPVPGPPPAAAPQSDGVVEQTAEDNAGEAQVFTYGSNDTYADTTDAAEQPETVARKALRVPAWWATAILGAVTLLLAGITYWMSRRR